MKPLMLSGIASFGLVFGAMPHEIDLPQNNQFHSIEQPIGNKIGVTIAGLGLMGLELWWFLMSKSKSQ